MKTKEELNALKEEVETLNQKLAELTEEELAQVSGGDAPSILTKLDLEPNASEYGFELPGDEFAVRNPTDAARP